MDTEQIASIEIEKQRLWLATMPHARNDRDQLFLVRTKMRAVNRLNRLLHIVHFSGSSAKKMLNNAPRPHADLIGIAFYLLPDLQIVEFVPSERRNWLRSISLVGVWLSVHALETKRKHAVGQVVKKMRNDAARLHPDLIGIKFICSPFYKSLKLFECMGTFRWKIRARPTERPDQWLAPTWSTQRSLVFLVSFLLGLGRHLSGLLFRCTDKWATNQLYSLSL
jgi:hypothetical protein